MKKEKKLGMAVVGGVIAIGGLWLGFGEKIKMLHTSLNSFKDENLAYTFQHTPEIQPTRKINKGKNTLFSSNSMGTSFVSALMGIAISEGYVDSVEDPIGKYIPEFTGTELEKSDMGISGGCRKGIRVNLWRLASMDSGFM